MEPEIEDLLKENLRLSKENNDLLKKVRQFQIWSRGFKIFYWVLIIGVAFGAFYFAQPYLEDIIGVYNEGLFNLN